MAKINYSVLRSMDRVDCTGAGFVANGIRYFSVKKRSGSRKIALRSMLNKRIATHTGLVIEVHGQKFIAEMIAGKNNGLQINSLEKYVKRIGWPSRRWILGIYRNPVFVDRALREKKEAEIALALRKMLAYDISGIGEFISNKVRDNKSKCYCSEFVYEITRDAIMYPADYWNSVSPYDLQQDKNGWEKVPNAII